jgi:phospholipase C
MFRNKFLRSTAFTLGLAGMFCNVTAGLAQQVGGTGSMSSAPTALSPSLTTAQKIALLRTKVKYVFVIFAENRSFDHYFGTFPGADGLFSAPSGFTPANQTGSFTQKYLDTNLQVQTISPFLIPNAVVNTANAVVPIYPADTVSVNHGHTAIVNGMDYQGAGIGGVSLNDRYAMTQEGLTTNGSGALVTSSGTAPTSISLAQKQTAEADMGHVDCDTIPFLWQWAKNFVLFDNFRQTTIGPSTPNAIAIIAGQSGETQWALHSTTEGATVSHANPAFPTPLGASYGSHFAGNSNAYVPVVGDPGPFPGSNLDHSAVKPPYNADENPANPSLNLTFATLPLSFMGSGIGDTIANDQNPRADLLDVQHDILTIASVNAPVAWGWYQQGFDAADEPDLTSGEGSPMPQTNPPTPGLYSGYVLHHNGPQYFGYLADNAAVLGGNLHGNADFFTAVNNKALPTEGGVFYLRGGYNNNNNLVPLDPTPAIKAAFPGNDDHPAYSDAQISEAMAAYAIDAIVNSNYWNESAIIITYDETDGLYDHEQPQVRNLFADGTPLSGGPRIPAIVISPWAATGTISHQYSEHGSVIKFIDELFGLVPLASLPDEKHARALGVTNLGQPNLEPSDDPANNVGDMTEAFDYTRIQNNSPLSSSLATFTPAQISTFPQLATNPNGLTNGACAAIGILPTDYPTQAAYTAGQPIDPPQGDFNPRPTQSPGIPTVPGWTP